MSENTFLGSVIETVKTIVYALLIAGAFRTIFFQPFWIPSGSSAQSQSAAMSSSSATPSPASILSSG